MARWRHDTPYGTAAPTLTFWPTPAKYNFRNGSCSSTKLVTLLSNGIEPRQRTGKLHVLSSATSLNMRSICSCTLLLTHSTPYSMILAVVVVVMLIGLPVWWYSRVDDRVELKLPRWPPPRNFRESRMLLCTDADDGNRRRLRTELRSSKRWLAIDLQSMNNIKQTNKKTLM